MDDMSYAPEHPAPPAYRPLSGTAVTALVLAIVFGLGAMAGVWWLVAAPLLLSVVAWGPIAAGRRRGRGLAIAAAAISVGAGAFGYFTWRGARIEFEDQFETILTALQKRDAAEVGRSVAKGEDAAAAVARWTANFDAAVADAGTYDGRVSIDAGWLGPLAAMLLAPKDVEEIGHDRPPPENGTAFWSRAAFRSKPVWVAALITKDGRYDAKSPPNKDQLSSGSRMTFFDVRFFREKTSSTDRGASEPPAPGR